ncbi:MAG: hypothetical protein QOH64_2320 [Acidimicrobiaceae bacterium]|jgi:hypothetical protein
MVLIAAALTPAQQEVLDQLGALGQTRPSFDAGLRGELRAALEEGVEPLVPLLDELGIDAEHPLTISKHTLSQVHGCEVRFLAEDGVFPGWSVPLARGTVAHKAIELSIHMRGEPQPSELVDDALARLTEGDHFLSEWLQQLAEAERAELRAEACDRVTKFLECWPPLKAAWRPVTESSLRADLLDGRIALKGKVDLTLGRADGTTAGRTVAGKVLIDLKTGGFSPHHLDDLRFYALLETIRLGVPPRRLSTYYLDRGAFLPEDVSEGLLATTVGRTIDGIAKAVALRGARVEPVHKPGPVCRWCPVLERCEVGTAHLAGADDW